MSNDIRTLYPGRINPADADYPFGSIKNESVPGANDGTPLTAEWGNDPEALKQAALYEAGEVPNGTTDTAKDSQILNAIKKNTATVADIATGRYPVGRRLIVTDRSDAPFDIVDSGSYVINGFDILNAGTGKVAIISTRVPYVLMDWLGDTSGDCYNILNHGYELVRCTVFGTSAAGRLGGKELRLSAQTYDFSQTLTVDAPVTIRGAGNGIATDSSERSVLNFIGSGAGILFGVNSGYCSLDNFTLRGSKAGSIDPETKVFGNRGLDMSQGFGGVITRMSFEFWDIGTLQYQRPGNTWSGAYRQFSFCRFRNNTYSTVHLDITTDCSYQGCDFRTNDNTGYILIAAGNTVDAYQNVVMSDCMFELLGGTSFETRGIQVKGKSTLYLHGRYLEGVAVFCDDKASVISSAYHRTENGTSSRVGGGGFVNMSQAFAHSEIYPVPLLDDPLWEQNNVSGGAMDYVDGKLCNKFTVTSATSPQLALNFAECFKSSIRSIPDDWRTMIALISFEYNSKIDTTASVRLVAQNQAVSETYTPVVSTWTDEDYYDTTAGWKRKTYTLPFNPDAMGALGHDTAAIRVYLDFKGSALAVNDVFGIRDLSIEFLAF